MNSALQICYYPVREVVAGGQIRTTQLSKLIRDIGYQQQFLGIFPHRHDGWKTDFPIDIEANHWVFRSPHDFEMRISDAVLANRKLHASILKFADQVNPNLLWFEHPFLWPLFREWASRRRKPIKIVYSSHNVEWAMKKQLLNKQALHDYYCLERLYTTERDLIFNADAVICCSNDDQKTYAYHGRKDVIVIPNGSSSPEYTDGEDSAELARYRKLIPANRLTFTFVSSWHEPNWFGFRDLVLPHMHPGGMLADATLVLMGDIGKLYEAWSVASGIRLPRIFCAGRVTDKEKSALFKLSDSIILPITEGGGTNLKTAEALLSNRVVTATTTAFRGFEKHTMTPGVFCKDNADFHQAIQQSIELISDLRSRNGLESFCAERHSYVSDCCWPNIIHNAKQELTIRLNE